MIPLDPLKVGPFQLKTAKIHILLTGTVLLESRILNLLLNFGGDLKRRIYSNFKFKTFKIVFIKVFHLCFETIPEDNSSSNKNKKAFCFIIIVYFLQVLDDSDIDCIFPYELIKIESSKCTFFCPIA